MSEKIGHFSVFTATADVNKPLTAFENINNLVVKCLVLLTV